MKLHLGCGEVDIPGFVNVDIADLDHIDYKRPIDDLSPLDDGSADLIYCSHAFEYFDRREAVDVLEEWGRVLKKRGALRLAVPDFEKLVEVYQKYGKLGKVIGPLYGRWSVPGSEEVIYHKTVYDFKDLKNLLEENGFEDVKRYDWRKTIHKDYDDYSQAYVPHMDKDNGLLVSLNVEAVKK